MATFQFEKDETRDLDGFIKKPVKWDASVAKQICELVGSNRTLGKALKEIDNPPHVTTVYHWLNGNLGAPESFRAEFDQAIINRSHQLANDIQDISDGAADIAHKMAMEGVERLKQTPIKGMSAVRMYDLVYGKTDKYLALQINGRKYLASKLNPAVYSEKQIIAHETPKPLSLNTAGLPTEVLEKIANLQEQIQTLQKEKGKSNE